MAGNVVPCPHCHELIDQNASFCRHCGSSDDDGWREEDDYSDEAVDDFDYDEFVRENFDSTPTATATRPIWKIVAIALLLVFAGSLIGLVM